MNDFIKICRLCAKKNIEFLDLNATYKSEITLYDMMAFCIPELVSEDDGLSTLICFSCKEVLINTYIVIEKWHKARAKLDKYKRQMKFKRYVQMDEYLSTSPEAIETKAYYDAEVEEYIKKRARVMEKYRSIAENTWEKQLPPEFCQVQPLFSKNQRINTNRLDAEVTKNKGFNFTLIDVNMQMSGTTFEVDEEKRNFQCNRCSKKFLNKTELFHHVVRHTSDCYACQFCSRTYYREENLNIHLKTHRQNYSTSVLANILNLPSANTVVNKVSEITQVPPQNENVPSIDLTKDENSKLNFLFEHDYLNSIDLPLNTTEKQDINLDSIDLPLPTIEKQNDNFDSIDLTLETAEQLNYLSENVDSLDLPLKTIEEHNYNLDSLDLPLETVAKQNDNLDVVELDEENLEFLNFICPVTNLPFSFDGTTYVCGTCQVKIERRAILRKHLKCHKKAFEYFCKICYKGYKYPSTLEMHTLLTHCQDFDKTSLRPSPSGRMKEKFYVCEFCGIKMKSHCNFGKHLLIHKNTRPYMCESCGKCFKTIGKLNRHKRTHNESKYFFCHICPNRFKYKSSLDLHLNMHAGVENFFCNICSKGFLRKDRLQRHLRAHTNLEERPIPRVWQRKYQCDICHISYKYEDRLREHMLTHLDNKTFNCEICGKGFLFPRTLKMHMIMHNNVKPHKCGKCGKDFKFPHTLKAHMKSHLRNLI